MTISVLTTTANTPLILFGRDNVSLVLTPGDNTFLVQTCLIAGLTKPTASSRILYRVTIALA